MTAALQACFDFHVRSSIELPELPLAAGDDARAVVDIVLGSTPDYLVGAEPPVLGLQCHGDIALLAIDGVAKFLIDGTTTITVDPAPGIRWETVRLFLLGSVMGLIGLKRGLLLLHANAVILGTGAHAFLGQSGAGKSTLAGQFFKAGYPLLSDDVCALSLAENCAPVAWPGVARLKLWRDAADALRYSTGDLQTLRDGFDKFSVPVMQQTPAPTPLRRAYVLERSARADECTVTKLGRREAMSALVQHSYRREYLAALGLTTHHFRQCAELAQSCEVYSLRRGWDLTGLDRQVALITDQLELLPA